MAKAKQDNANISLKATEEAYRPVTREDRTPIDGRTRYRLTDKYTVPGYTKPLPDTAVLVECYDGYWAVIINGEQQCYRLGPIIIDYLKNILTPINTQHE